MLLNAPAHHRAGRPCKGPLWSRDPSQASMSQPSPGQAGPSHVGLKTPLPAPSSICLPAPGWLGMSLGSRQHLKTASPFCLERVM